MAGGAIVSGGAVKDYPGHLTSNVFFTCFAAALGGLIFGYDLGISGGVTSMNPFLKKFFPKVYRRETTLTASSNQYCTFNDETLTLFTSSLYLAALVSSLGFSSFMRRFGRKKTMIIGGCLFIAGGVLNGLAEYLWMLIVGRLLLGFGIGCANQSVPIYVSEIAPHKFRGMLNNMFQLTITIGILLANALNYVFTLYVNPDIAWRWSLGCAAFVGALFTVCAFLLPDSPNYLVVKGKIKEARIELEKIRGVKDVDEELNDLVEACNQSSKVENQWSALLFKRKYRPALVFSIAIPFFQQLTGMNVFMFYAPVLFKSSGLGDKASLLSSLITGGVNAAATLVCIFLVDKVGRRKLFLQGGAQMIICQIIMTIGIKNKFGWNGNPTHISHGFGLGMVIIVCLYVAAFAWSWGPLGWLVPSEIFPLEVRSAAQSVNVAVNMIFTFFIAQIFTLILCKMRWAMFLVFLVCVFAMSVFIFLLLPETKGVPIEEMYNIWKEHPRWSKIVKDKDDSLPSPPRV